MVGPALPIIVMEESVCRRWIVFSRCTCMSHGRGLQGRMRHYTTRHDMALVFTHVRHGCIDYPCPSTPCPGGVNVTCMKKGMSIVHGLPNRPDMRYNSGGAYRVVKLSRGEQPI